VKRVQNKSIVLRFHSLFGATINRNTLKSICAATAFLMLSTGGLLAFGGEDATNGNPWHHEDITKRALTGYADYEDLGFGAAASAIAWHSDNIDSYLYNPIFWAQGGRKRLQAALVGYEELAKLHFDDTFTSAGLKATWQRYAAGTIAGLYWASLQGVSGDMAAGQNILGVSLHVVQDFYSHSNWVDDPGRRCQTVLQTPRDERFSASLYSGAYELPQSGAPKHHGAYSVSCSLLRGETMDEVLDPICTGYSPFQNLGICQDWRVCQGGSEVVISLNDAARTGWVYLEPAGIALDNTWLSRVQAPNRGLVDAENLKFLDGRGGTHLTVDECDDIINAGDRAVCQQDADMMFAITKDLAMRSSVEWLQYLEEVMTAMGPKQQAFWNNLKSFSSSPAAREQQFEDFSKLPYQFLSAGPYPVSNPSTPEREIAGSSNGWYLRVRLRTSSDTFAGTDSDIKAIVTVNGRKQAPILLDYLRTDARDGRVTSPLLVYNDFETGANDVYTIGPFSARPSAIEFYNDSGSGGEVLDAIWTDFTHIISNGVTGARRALLSLIGGNTDYVASAFGYYDYDELVRFFAAAPNEPGGTGFRIKTLTLDGGDEGKHQITIRFRPVPTILSDEQRQKNWLGFEIQLQRLTTINESKVDQGSTSDEPFVILHMAPLNGLRENSSTYLSPVVKDMDDGDFHIFPRRTGSARYVKVPPAGGLVLGAQVWESDTENAYDRNQLRLTFESGFDEETRQASGRFLDEVGRLLAADWKLDEVEVFAFERGAIPTAGPVLNARNIDEIEGDETSRRFHLNWSKVRPLLTAEMTINSWTAAPVGTEILKGEWDTQGVICDGTPQDGRVDLTVEDPNVSGSFAGENQCLPSGSELLSGAFNGQILQATLQTPVPPVEEDPAETVAPVVLPGDQRPDYFNPDIDPNLSLEGNWIIKWARPEQGDVLTGYATLLKGASYGCVGDNGCWYQFTRRPDSAWNLSFWMPPDSGNSGGVTLHPNGKLEVEYGNYHLGYWGGNSAGTATGDTITGRWSYGEQGGSEIWTRVQSAVEQVEVLRDEQWIRLPVGDPVEAQVPYSAANNNMRGNRPGFWLNLYGSNLWGQHYYWMPRSSDIEISGIGYICAGENPPYPVHSNSHVCLNSGGVSGVQIYFNAWAGAKPGRQALYFDDQVIEFNLDITGHPDAVVEEVVATSRPVELSFESCSVLREINPPEGIAPLILRRVGSY
jgi:hypothetical protein